MRFLLLPLLAVGMLIGNSSAQDTTGEPAPAAEPAAAEDAEEPPTPYEEYTATPGYSVFATNNLWILIAAALVFIMHLGFSTLEVGLTRKKNTVNILFKNVWIIAIGILTYYLCGFNMHYPSEWIIEGVFALGGPAGYDLANAAAVLANSSEAYNPGYTYWSDFIFQAMFAATGATIVSGAVAERIKLPGFMIFATVFVAFGYTIAGSWHWGGGWLAGLGFADFAGSTVVHAFGGFGALACVMLLGPRKGKYTVNGIRPILGHSLPLAAIGVFLLWLGWFGFNGGSVLSADAHGVSLVFVTTSLAACAGAVGAIFVAWIFIKKPDLSMALNGILAGLVGITAGADVISPPFAILVGLIAGALVVFSILFFDKIRIDDPVGAISVHGVCGVWGTLAVGIFGGANFVTQLIGTVAVSAFAFGFAFIVFLIIKVTMGVRVSEEEEDEGLDLGEHGQPAYSGE
ncbi:MAG: Amt family ammonium transporter [Verrucomicrobiales bacterium]|jgi:Amt family ammonium transporter